MWDRTEIEEWADRHWWWGSMLCIEDLRRANEQGNAAHPSETSVGSVSCA